MVYKTVPDLTGKAHPVSPPPLKIDKIKFFFLKIHYQKKNYYSFFGNENLKKKNLWVNFLLNIIRFLYTLNTDFNGMVWWKSMGSITGACEERKKNINKKGGGYLRGKTFLLRYPFFLSMCFFFSTQTPVVQWCNV